MSKHVTMKRLLHVAAGSLGLALLAACGDGVPEATDDQLLQLVGNQSSFMGSTAPLAISKRTVECVRALSGVDDDIYKDMPAEMLGTFKTHCRKDLSTRVADNTKNPLGFKLESFENKALAERITKLKATTDESNRIAAEKERERIKAENLAKKQAELDAEREQYQAFVDSIDGRVQKAGPRCEAWLESQRAVKAREKYSQWAYRRAPEICQKQALVQVREAAKRNQDHLARQKINSDAFGMGFSKPYYGTASATWFEQQEARLDKEIAQMKDILSK